MLTAKSSLADREQKLSQNWASFQYLTILSWHNAKGAAIAGTMNVKDSSILLPVQDRNLTDCCAAGIKFVRVLIKLDFADLMIAIANPAPKPSCRGSTTFSFPRVLSTLSMAATSITSWQRGLVLLTSLRCHPRKLSATSWTSPIKMVTLIFLRQTSTSPLVVWTALLSIMNSSCWWCVSPHTQSIKPCLWYSFLAIQLCHPFPCMHSVFDHQHKIPPGFLGGVRSD